MVLLTDLSDNKDGEENGAWFTFRGLDLKLRSNRAKVVAAAIDRAGISRRAGTGGLSARDLEKLDEIVAKHVLVAWGEGERGVETEPGVTAECTLELKLKLMASEEFAATKIFILQQMQDYHGFWRRRPGVDDQDEVEVIEEDAAKNSLRSSASSSKSARTSSRATGSTS